MVRMVAMTASLAMSSQVGATAVRTRSAASANSSASRIQVANLSQISRPASSLAPRLKIAPIAPMIACSARKLHDEDRACLDEERDIDRDLAELLLERDGHAPNCTRPRLARTAAPAQASIQCARRPESRCHAREGGHPVVTDRSNSARSWTRGCPVKPGNDKDVGPGGPRSAAEVSPRCGRFA